MSRDDLLAMLHKIKQDQSGDPEQDHVEADGALLDFINDPEVTEAFRAIRKWYS